MVDQAVSGRLPITGSLGEASAPPVPLVGDGVPVACADGTERPYLSMDAAASTAALGPVLARVQEFIPWYSSVHRGAGHKSQIATGAYEDARAAAVAFAGRAPSPGGRSDDVAIICRNTTEALNHLVYRLGLARDDVVVTTVAEHHANLLPWFRAATCRHVECGRDGTFGAGDVVSALDRRPAPRVLAITGASNITGWMPPLDQIIMAAHDRGIPVVVDAAQLAPHRPLPADADFLAWSGHKMYAPFGAGVLLGPARAFADGDPFLAGGGAVDLVDLDEVVWTEPPEREEAGSPNVIGAVALHAAIESLAAIGWSALLSHERRIARLLREGLAAIPGVRLLGPGAAAETLPVATFTVEGVPHALVAARLAAEEAIGVRHGCFCAHPYLMRLLGLTGEEIRRYRDQLRHGDRSEMPGAVRASAGVNTTDGDIARLLDAVARVARGDPPPVPYRQDRRTGDFHTSVDIPGLTGGPGSHSSACSPG
ncbi:MAG TPA: aminotransferase class V-fold PLP-dependent enzyme [Streptosporangiaceae bacterium]|nr:aminotransferase class V-fold PLP-dependent enzyme [Streptosporangiaceae bacterium]